MNMTKGKITIPNLELTGDDSHEVINRYLKDANCPYSYGDTRTRWVETQSHYYDSTIIAWNSEYAIQLGVD